MLPTHGDFPKAMRELAKEKNVALVDLNLLTKEHFEKMGKDSTNKTVYFPNDGSHLQKSGAIIISRLFVNSIVEQNVLPLCSWVKNPPVPIIRPFYKAIFRCKPFEENQQGNLFLSFCQECFMFGSQY
jgi:hypothetical protein